MEKERESESLLLACVCFSVSPVGAKAAAGGVSGCGISNQSGPARCAPCAAAPQSERKRQSR